MQKKFYWQAPENYQVSCMRDTVGNSTWYSKNTDKSLTVSERSKKLLDNCHYWQCTIGMELTIHKSWRSLWRSESTNLNR